MKLFKYSLIIFLLQPHFGQAYPWTFFKETKQKNYLELDLHSSYFLKGDYSAFGGGRLEYHNSKLDLDLDYHYSFLEKKHYFRFGELSVNFPLWSEKLKLILGFRDHAWSESDRYWDLGLWQPRYLFDPFRPEQASLPGFYLDYKSGNSLMTLYLSYFYLPDMIIYPELKQGKIISKNPYFSIAGIENINWNVSQLRSFEFVSFLKPLIAFQIQHRIDHSDLSLSYAYKPKNQIQYFVKTEGINLSSNQISGVTVSGIDYDTAYHHLVTFETEMSVNEDISLFLSLFYEKPDQLERRQDWVSDISEPHLTFSALTYFKDELNESERTIFSLGYINNFESRTLGETSNVITEDLENIFGSRPNWKHAVSLSIEYWTKTILNGFEFNLRLNRALDNDIYSIIFDKKFYLTPSFQVYVSGDFLFRFSRTAIKKDTSLISRYKNLSRGFGGIKYVF